MPGPQSQKRTRATPGPPPNDQAACAPTAAPKAGNGGRHGQAERRVSETPEPALRGLLHGLRAGDLECVLLTVAMAADENRMPCADPDEAERILAFPARLAEHDAALPPCPDGAGSGWNRPVDAD